MDYKKKYEDALKRAKAIIKVAADQDGAICFANTIFPELKENEDERIIKALKEGFKYHQLFNPTFSGIPCVEIVNWLERQDTNISSFPKEQQVFMKKYVSLDKITLIKLLAERDANNAEIIESFEKQGVQKLADKVEPKFKVGDWITNGRYAKLIVGINSDWPYYMFEDGTSKRIKDIDKKYHLWTIQDAKDGDILFQDLIGGKTFIYNGVNSNMAILYSFIISNDGKDVLPYHIGKPNTGIGNIEENKNIIHPATKEQCDLLFQKIKEAGYEWDADNKELKKIHVIDEGKAEIDYCFTKMMNGKKVSLSEEDEDMIQALDACIDTAIKSGMNYISFDSKSILIGKVKNWLKSIKDRVQPKQEWSDENNKWIESLIQTFEDGYLEGFNQLKSYGVIDWLKSLKQRIGG